MTNNYSNSYNLCSCVYATCAFGPCSGRKSAQTAKGDPHQQGRTKLCLERTGCAAPGIQGRSSLGWEVRRHERGLLLDILALCDIFSSLKAQLYSLLSVPSSPCLFFLNSVHSFSSANSSDRKSLAFSWYLKILHFINANCAATPKGSM